MPSYSYTYNTAGDYTIKIEAKDDKGASRVTSNPLMVYAGNETPHVNIELTDGNKSFYLPVNRKLYGVSVKIMIPPRLILPICMFRLIMLRDLTKPVQPWAISKDVASISGKNLMLSLDCKSCHKEAEKSIGPSYLQVSEKYQKERGAMNYLTEKIIKGGSRCLGRSGHACTYCCAKADVKQIVTWIMSLANKTANERIVTSQGNHYTCRPIKSPEALWCFGKLYR